MGSPLFAYHPLPACRGYAPRKHRSSLTLAAAVILPSPQGTAGRLLHTCSISGLFIPFTDVPAYVLPVYASPCALPHPTQDSVPDCWLRFVRAAIADGWTICACKAQPPPNRTYISRCIRLSLLEFLSEIALNLSLVRADSIRMSLQLIAKASGTVSLPLSVGLSSVLPQLIPWLIQRLLVAQPITGKRWVLWRLRCHTGGGTSAQHRLRQSCVSA